jgi:hypothetical protein
MKTKLMSDLCMVDSFWDVYKKKSVARPDVEI